MRLRAPSQRHRPVEWKSRGGHATYALEKKWRQVQSNGSTAKRVLASFSPMMAETMCLFISAPLNGRGSLAWQKVRRFLTRSKSTPGAVRVAQKTCEFDNIRC